MRETFMWDRDARKITNHISPEMSNRILLSYISSNREILDIIIIESLLYKAGVAE